MTAVLSILIILTGIVWYILNVDKARSQRRTEIMSRPFPDKWKTIIEKSGPLTKKLPESLKKDLYRKVQVFIEEISFEGCKGFEITETVKVSVAAQACILLLNRPNSFYNKLKTILIYPDTYVAKNASIAGMHTEPNEIPVAGQSYDSGTVILAWRHVTRGAGNRKDGNNVVFHEFAHQLDQEDG